MGEGERRVGWRDSSLNIYRRKRQLILLVMKSGVMMMMVIASLCLLSSIKGWVEWVGLIWVGIEGYHYALLTHIHAP